MKRDSERIYDEYLATAAVTGDRRALDRLVARWQPRLLRHARRVLGDADAARDVVQEAWMEIVRGLGRLHDVAAFPAWSYRIVTRRCQRRFGRVALEAWDGEQELPQSVTSEEVAHPGELAADIQVVLKAMHSLPAPQRAALALFHLDELSVAEIAIALDVPPGTVKTRLMHARRKLRALLEGETS